MSKIIHIIIGDTNVRQNRTVVDPSFTDAWIQTGSHTDTQYLKIIVSYLLLFHYVVFDLRTIEPSMMQSIGSIVHQIFVHVRVLRSRPPVWTIVWFVS